MPPPFSQNQSHSLCILTSLWTFVPIYFKISPGFEEFQNKPEVLWQFFTGFNAISAIFQLHNYSQLLNVPVGHHQTQHILYTLLANALLETQAEGIFCHKVCNHKSLQINPMTFQWYMAVMLYHLSYTTTKFKLLVWPLTLSCVIQRTPLLTDSQTSREKGKCRA